ncbi:hypothetical protein Sa4125_03390 [Aureimonas sp. SA4125]|uniref:hypothetical protein n=1 Tax=Aureimonas sp. SA4125 TaxID=2826993 RepID=UPI001CC4BCAF|nr:hypothetical protein [Aureimonas sp. SA4125]BDA82797.1 hypothetical protein Sa4125_03390 [Aureimonas sp. SA4125]
MTSDTKPTANENDPHPLGDGKTIPGQQHRPLTDEEDLDNAIDDTFPASDPVPPSRIDGPND